MNGGRGLMEGEKGGGGEGGGGLYHDLELNQDHNTGWKKFHEEQDQQESNMTRINDTVHIIAYVSGTFNIVNYCQALLPFYYESLIHNIYIYFLREEIN